MTLKLLVLVLLLTPRALVLAAPEVTPGNGLETERTTPLGVLVEGVSEDAEKIGLTRDRIEARVNQSLRRAGITPEEPTVRGMMHGRLYLYVNVNVLGSCFNISISLKREVYYRSGDKSFAMLGVTWDTGTTGQARSSTFILDKISEDIELFCNEFLKANGK
jgi:hypothetical protein